jgi:hypothetical protein
MMVEGTATRVSRHVERSKAVLRCVLVTESGRRLAMEMRADEIHGLVDDGDRVVVATPPATDGVLRPASVRNLTTGSEVEAWRRTRVGTALGALPGFVGSALVGSVITAVVKTITSPGETASTPSEPTSTSTVSPGHGLHPRDPAPAPDPQPDDAPSDRYLLALVVASFVVVWLLVRFRRSGRALRVTTRWVVAGGLLLGVVVGVANPW